MKLQKFRQVTLVVLCLFLSITSLKSQTKTKIDYSINSNILHPDTLNGDQKAIFWCFAELSSEEIENLDPIIIKEKFAGIGITLKEDKRFGRAFIFYDTTMKNHKISCEQWESFKDLAPK